MKALFISIFLSLSCLTFGQGNYEIADSTKEWNTVLSTIGGWNIQYCGGTTIHYFGGEIYYNDERCLLVRETKDSTYMDWDEIGFLREDTLNRKVFFDEGLIYDFTLGPGDSVIIDNHYIGFSDQLMICDSIDSLLLNGELRKRFYFNRYLPGYYKDIWIEDVGSIYGLLYSGMYAADYTGGQSNLICCKENDTTIYYDSIYWDCFIEHFYPQIISEHFDTAFVGMDYSFQLLVDTIQVDSFSINAEIIPDGFTFDESTFLLTGKPDSVGAFTCAITSSNYDFDFNTDLIYDEIVVVLPTTNNAHFAQHEINIYPKPFNSIIYVDVKPWKEDRYLMEVLNANGQFIEAVKITSGHFGFDTNHFKKGLYLFRIFTTDNREIVVEKTIKL